MLTQNLSRHFGKVNVSTQFDSRHIKPIMLVLIELPHVANDGGHSSKPLVIELIVLILRKANYTEPSRSSWKDKSFMKQLRTYKSLAYKNKNHSL